jgi:hypothetical protein
MCPLLRWALAISRLRQCRWRWGSLRLLLIGSYVIVARTAGRAHLGLLNALVTHERTSNLCTVHCLPASFPFLPYLIALISKLVFNSFRLTSVRNPRHSSLFRLTLL